MSAKSPADKSSQKSFADLSAELERVLAELQAEDLDVDRALELHDTGTKLIRHLEARITEAELTVKKLKLKHN